MQEDEKTQITISDWKMLKEQAALNIKQSKIAIIQFTELMNLAETKITECGEAIEKEVEAELENVEEQV